MYPTEARCREAHPEIVAQLNQAIRNVQPQNEFEQFCLDTWAAGRTPGGSTRDGGYALFIRLVTAFCRIERAERVDVVLFRARGILSRHAREEVEHELGDLKNKYARIITSVFRGGFNPAIMFVFDSYYSIGGASSFFNALMLVDFPTVWFDKDPTIHQKHPFSLFTHPLPTYNRNPFAADVDVWENQALVWAYAVTELKTCGDVARVVIKCLRGPSWSARIDT